jgi:hypothetical protein
VSTLAHFFPAPPPPPVYKSRHATQWELAQKALLFTNFWACAIMQIKWIMADANLFRRLKMGVRPVGGGGGCFLQHIFGRICLDRKQIVGRSLEKGKKGGRVNNLPGRKTGKDNG